MTEISFHFNVPDSASYACRLLRKATRRGARVAVTGTPAVLSRLDQDLWSFDAVEFIAHVYLRDGQATPQRLLPTPVWLVERPQSAPHHDVLVNLGLEVPAGYESYSKLFEIVSTDGDERAAARLRWKRYADRGYPIIRHEVSE